jgi:hypothetical protein
MFTEARARGKPSSNNKRKRANPRTRGDDDDGAASDSTTNAGPDRKKVHWKSKSTATAASLTAETSTRGKRAPRAPSRSSIARPTTTGTEQGSTTVDGGGSDSEEEERSEDEEDESSVNLDKVRGLHRGEATICADVYIFRLAWLRSVSSMYHDASPSLRVELLAAALPTCRAHTHRSNLHIAAALRLRTTIL